MTACQNLLANTEMKARNSLLGRTLARAKQNGSPDKYLEVISRLSFRLSDWHRPKTADTPSQFSHGRGHTRMEEIILAWKEPYSHPVATCEFLLSGSVVNATKIRQRVHSMHVTDIIEAACDTADAKRIASAAKQLLERHKRKFLLHAKGLALLAVGHARLPVGSQHNFVAPQRNPIISMSNPMAHIRVPHGGSASHVQTRKIIFSAGIRLSPGPSMAAKLEGGIAAHWRDATPEQLSVSLPWSFQLQVPLEERAWKLCWCIVQRKTNVLPTTHGTQAHHERNDDVLLSGHMLRCVERPSKATVFALWQPLASVSEVIVEGLENGSRDRPHPIRVQDGIDSKRPQREGH
ncbi:hypothetical protein BD769DRAFT_1385860 [Suillus cothurnatus]|nr:hypothetical protein BD769DRAFT_1385860 [Suillus cothurnatus]